jgi:hypothetical protein
MSQEQRNPTKVEDSEAKKFREAYVLKRKHEDDNFLVEDWYPKLKEFTAKTIFLEL